MLAKIIDDHDIAKSEKIPIEQNQDENTLKEMERNSESTKKSKVATNLKETAIENSICPVSEDLFQIEVKNRFGFFKNVWKKIFT